MILFNNLYTEFLIKAICFFFLRSNLQSSSFIFLCILSHEFIGHAVQQLTFLLVLTHYNIMFLLIEQAGGWCFSWLPFFFFPDHFPSSVSRSFFQECLVDSILISTLFARIWPLFLFTVMPLACQIHGNLVRHFFLNSAHSLVVYIITLHVLLRKVQRTQSRYCSSSPLCLSF